MITRVRVPSTWTIPSDNRYAVKDTWYGMANFTLGEGPCGKTVERLDVIFHAHGVEIVQICTCTEQKNFVYPWHTITGRVEVTHG